MKGSPVRVRASALKIPCKSASSVVSVEDDDERAGYVSFSLVRSLQRFIARECSAQIRKSHLEDGYPLGGWVANQRRAYAAGRLSADRSERLDELAGSLRPLAGDEQERVLAKVASSSGVVTGERGASSPAQLERDRVDHTKAPPTNATAQRSSIRRAAAGSR
jgi:hypothetical protein